MMKRLFLFFLPILTLFACFSCKEETGLFQPNYPPADCDFVVVQTGPMEYCYKASRTTHAKYQWSVNGKIYGIDTAICFKFSQAGTYVVELQIEKQDGSTCKSGKPLTIYPGGVKELQIKRIFLYDFPDRKENGDYWDDFSGNPDPYFIIKWNKSGKKIMETKPVDNLRLSVLPYAFEVNQKFNISELLTDELVFDLYDEDIGTDDFMASLRTEKIYRLAESKPSVIDLYLNDKNYRIKLEVAWY